MTFGICLPAILFVFYFVLSRLGLKSRNIFRFNYLKSIRSLSWDEGEAEAQVVVPVVGRIPIAVRWAAITRIVVPAAATIHAMRTSSMEDIPNIFLKKPFVSARCTNDRSGRIWSAYSFCDQFPLVKLLSASWYFCLKRNFERLESLNVFLIIR